MMLLLVLLENQEKKVKRKTEAEKLRSVNMTMYVLVSVKILENKWSSFLSTIFGSSM